MFQKAIALLAFPLNALGSTLTGHRVVAIVDVRGIYGHALDAFVGGGAV